MGQEAAGPRPATDAKLARVAAQIRDDYGPIAALLESAAAKIETLVLPGGAEHRERVIATLGRTLAAIRGLGASGAPDFAAVAAIERDLTELYRDLAALGDTVGGE